MTYDPKWIRDDETVKRDGTNDLTGDWDIGDERSIILDELQIRDTSGLTVSDTTGNLIAQFTNDGLFRLESGVGVNQFSTDSTLSNDSDNIVPTQSAIKSYVDTSIAGFSTTPEAIYYNNDSTAGIRALATENAVELYYGEDKVAETVDIGAGTYKGISIFGPGGTDQTDLYQAAGQPDFAIHNQSETGWIFLRGTNTSSEDRTFLTADPDSEVRIYHPGTNALVWKTQSKGILTGSGQNIAILSESGYVSIYNTDHGGNVRITGEQGDGTPAVLFDGDPDGAVDLYYAGVKKFETTEDGAKISSDDSYVQLVDDATNAGYFEVVTDGVQVAYFDAEASSIRLGKATSAGRIEISDTRLDAYIGSSTYIIWASETLQRWGSISDTYMQTNQSGTIGFVVNSDAKMSIADSSISMGDSGDATMTMNMGTKRIDFEAGSSEVLLLEETSQTLGVDSDSRIVVDQSIDQINMYVGSVQPLSLSTTNQYIGVTGDTQIQIGQSSNLMTFRCANTVQMSLDTDGFKLKDGEWVTEISNDSTADLQTQLMTAEAIQGALDVNHGTYVHTQSTDSTSWIVTHNLGYQYVNVEVIDENDLAIIPDEISFDSATQLTITFLQDETGFAAVTSGGGSSGVGVKQGRVALFTDDTTADVVFSSSEPNELYSISISFSSSNSNPSQFSYTIFDKTVDGFSVRFSGPIEDNSYILEWMIGRSSSDENRTWVAVHDDYTANLGEKLVVFTDTTAVTVTLPASPTFGDQIDVVDGDINFATNNCTLDRNGNNIDGNAGDYILNSDKADVRLVYVNASTGWRVMT